jgi:hypothetical protein
MDQGAAALRAYPRRGRAAASFDHLHRGLPFIGIVFRFRQFGDVLGGIAQRAQGLAIDSIGSKNS